MINTFIFKKIKTAEKFTAGIKCSNCLNTLYSKEFDYTNYLDNNTIRTTLEKEYKDVYRCPHCNTLIRD